MTANDPTAALLDHFASYRVPHGWFIHFYFLSVGLSILWAHQIWMRRPAFEFLAAHSGVKLENSMSANRAALGWCFMLVQGLRRLVECVLFAKRSSSQMWIGHWVLGLLFYAFMSISVWIEGSRMHTIDDYSALADSATASLLDQSRPCTSVADYGELLSQNILPTCLFFFASGAQFRAHQHLASLPAAPNYALPTAMVFNRTLTPHYFAECLVYFALSRLAAPEGQILNKTIASALAFEVINLGITADQTYKWYERRFGPQSIKSRARMVPGVW